MEILGEQIPLKDNLLRSLHTHRLAWIVLVVTAFFDFASTLFFMTGIGIGVERNPLVRWLAENLGIVPGVALAKCLQLGAAAGFTALSLKHSRAILMLLIVINTLATLFNLFLEPRTPLP